MASASGTSPVRFDTTLSAFGNNTGIVVPPEVIDTLGAGKRPAVVVDVNGYEYRSTIGTMNGPRVVEIPAELSDSLQRYHVDNINAAKTDATRQRRVDKAIKLFLEGKPR